MCALHDSLYVLWGREEYARHLETICTRVEEQGPVTNTLGAAIAAVHIAVESDDVR